MWQGGKHYILNDGRKWPWTVNLVFKMNIEYDKNKKGEDCCLKTVRDALVYYGINRTSNKKGVSRLSEDSAPSKRPGTLDASCDP